MSRCETRTISEIVPSAKSSEARRAASRAVSIFEPEPSGQVAWSAIPQRRTALRALTPIV